MNELQEFIEQLRLEQDKVLTEKTSWGRVELKTALEMAISHALMTLMSKQKNPE